MKTTLIKDFWGEKSRKKINDDYLYDVVFRDLLHINNFDWLFKIYLDCEIGFNKSCHTNGIHFKVGVKKSREFYSNFK